MESTIKQQMIRTMERLPDKALEEMATFVAYLQYKYVINGPVSPPRSSDTGDPWETFMQLMQQVQEGPWESEHTAGEILSAMRR